MSTGGDDEVAIDEELVRRLLDAQFPHWSDLPIASVPVSGMDNATFRLGDRLSVRLPRFPRWAGQVEREHEHEWLPRLAPCLPLPMSRPVAMGGPGEGYPFPWSVCRWLEGEPATAKSLADPLATATELAGFITALQAIDATGGPDPRWSNAFRGVPLGDECDSPASEARVRPRIEALRRAGLGGVRWIMLGSRRHATPSPALSSVANSPVALRAREGPPPRCLSPPPWIRSPMTPLPDPA
ncbi:phosphotransferase [Streptomyces sp. FIT100]|nr:phosphotransferase [Streptomyces sp. FIT100]